MLLARSHMIPIIDSFLESEAGIPVEELMGRSGRAVEEAVRAVTPEGGKVIILCGSGNNGGDGYSAGFYLSSDYNVSVFNVFSREPRGAAALHWKKKCEEAVGAISCGTPSDGELDDAICLVDAIFGTGFSGDIPDALLPLIKKVNEREGLKVISVDVPLGISADDGALLNAYIKASVTVSLSIPKVGLYSYPAKEYVGRIIDCDIGINKALLPSALEFCDHLIDEDFVRSNLPKRGDNTNKGSFGRSLLIVGSRKYTGAAFLSSEAALRSGAGYVSFIGDEFLVDRLLPSYPEMLYKRLTVGEDNEAIISSISDGVSVLIGCGCGVSRELYELLLGLLRLDITLILDADAINSLSEFGSPSDLKGARARLLLTPHPLEFSRLSGLSLEYVQANRYKVAKEFARECGCVLVLKGAATVVTDGEMTYINGCGSSALAKAGSGDVLAGIMVSVSAYTREPVISAALSVYLHARAADTLSLEYSRYGVMPSDLPKTVGKILAEFDK